MKKMTLEDLLDSPIAYQRVFVYFAGVTGAVFFSQAIYWSKRTKDGWFYKTQKEWEFETGLSRKEQESARRKLKKVGFLKEKTTYNPHQVHFFVDWVKMKKVLER